MRWSLFSSGVICNYMMLNRLCILLALLLADLASLLENTIDASEGEDDCEADHGNDENRVFTISSISPPISSPSLLVGHFLKVRIFTCIRDEADRHEMVSHTSCLLVLFNHSIHTNDLLAPPKSDRVRLISLPSLVFLTQTEHGAVRFGDLDMANHIIVLHGDLSDTLAPFQVDIMGFTLCRPDSVLEEPLVMIG